MPPSPNADVAAAVARVTGRRPVGWRPARSGYTRLPKWLVELDDGSSAFVKASAGERVGDDLDAELRVYEAVEGDFVPRLVGLVDEDDLRVLVLEDLSEARWPPPYPDDVTPLFDALNRLAEVEPPPAIALLERGEEPRWEQVGRDPEAFLRLGLCSREWLEGSLAALVEAERGAVIAGDRLVHNDLYSGNLCFAGDRAVLVDWAVARRGDPLLDRAFAVLSVRVEGGRLPPLEFPGEASFAALLSGLGAVEAPLPLPDWAESGSTLRQDQAGDLRHSLAWAAETLGLPPPS